MKIWALLVGIWCKESLDWKLSLDLPGFDCWTSDSSSSERKKVWRQKTWRILPTLQQQCPNQPLQQLCQQRAPIQGRLWSRSGNCTGGKPASQRKINLINIHLITDWTQNNVSICKRSINHCIAYSLEPLLCIIKKAVKCKSSFFISGFTLQRNSRNFIIICQTVKVIRTPCKVSKWRSLHS